jgi:hypothetical protein
MVESEIMAFSFDGKGLKPAGSIKVKASPPPFAPRSLDTWATRRAANCIIRHLLLARRSPSVRVNALPISAH